MSKKLELELLDIIVVYEEDKYYNINILIYYKSNDVVKEYKFLKSSKLSKKLLKIEYVKRWLKLSWKMILKRNPYRFRVLYYNKIHTNRFPLLNSNRLTLSIKEIRYVEKK